MEIIFFFTTILQWNKHPQIWKYFPENILQLNKRSLKLKLLFPYQWCGNNSFGVEITPD